MKPELVIFDCDGVLVDSEVATNQVMIDSLAQHGLQLTLTEGMAHFVGGTMKDVVVKATKLGATLPDTWLADIRTACHNRLRQGVPVIAGIPALLDLLDAHDTPYCVASNGPVAKMEITLGQTGLWDRFQGRMFSGPAYGVAKPDPDLFLIAAEKLAVHPGDCVVIEDSLSGVIAARRAGMRCFGYAPDGDIHGMANEGAELFTAMAHLPELLKLKG